MNDFGAVLACAAAVNRFVEFMRPLVGKLNLSEEVYKSVLVLIAVLSGIAVALMGKLNLFVGVDGMNDLLGILLTGVVSGLGADVLNAVIDLLYGWRDTVRARAVVNYREGDLMLVGGEKKIAA